MKNRETESKAGKMLQIPGKVKHTSGLFLLGHVECLVSVLRGVEVVDAGGVRGEGHVGQASLGVLFEELKCQTE